MDTCMFSCHIVEWIAPKCCKLYISRFVLNYYPSLADYMLHVVYVYCHKLAPSQDVREADFYS